MSLQSPPPQTLTLTHSLYPSLNASKLMNVHDPLELLWTQKISLFENVVHKILKVKHFVIMVWIGRLELQAVPERLINSNTHM